MAQTTFIAGTKAKASEVNDNFTGVLMNRKVFTDATEYTVTSTTPGEVASFQLTGVENAMILGVYVTCRVKNSNASTATGVNIKVSGSSLGSTYLTAENALNIHTGTIDSYSAKWSATVDDWLIWVIGSSYSATAATNFIPLKLLDDTTTFTVQLWSSDGSDTAFVNTFKVEVLYVKDFDEV